MVQKKWRPPLLSVIVSVATTVYKKSIKVRTCFSSKITKKKPTKNGDCRCLHNFIISVATLFIKKKLQQITNRQWKGQGDDEGKSKFFFQILTENLVKFQVKLKFLKIYMKWLHTVTKNWQKNVKLEIMVFDLDLRVGICVVCVAGV